MVTDGYGYVINAKATYIDIAEKLLHGKPVIIGWTDECGWCQDILFAAKAYHQVAPVNTLTTYHPNENIDNLLFVGVDGGMHGFKIDDSILNENYISEKLNLGSCNITNERLAILINNVKLVLRNMILDPKAYEFDFNFKKPQIEE